MSHIAIASLSSTRLTSALCFATEQRGRARYSPRKEDRRRRPPPRGGPLRPPARLRGGEAPLSSKARRNDVSRTCAAYLLPHTFTTDHATRVLDLYSPDELETFNAKRRAAAKERYKNDTDFRARLKAASRKYLDKKKKA